LDTLNRELSLTKASTFQVLQAHFVFSKPPSKMSSCTVPTNQPIYQALIDKADSYPADKAYQAKAYQKAAESVATWNYNLYNDYIPSVPGVGDSIHKFIKDFIQNNPAPKPNGMWEQLKEMVTPELYTAENPRRSARIASKMPATKPPVIKPVTKPVTKPIVTPSVVKYFPEEKKASTAVPIIRTYGADDDGYTTTGYALYRANGKFEIINVGHCSCFDTVEILEGYDEDEYENTLAHIVCLATSKSDPRVPDVVTEDPHLLALYASILEHKDVLETWSPEELDEHLDMIEVHDPDYKHRS
jgi:hypothetical protein